MFLGFIAWGKIHKSGNKRKYSVYTFFGITYRVTFWWSAQNFKTLDVYIKGTPYMPSSLPLLLQTLNFPWPQAETECHWFLVCNMHTRLSWSIRPESEIFMSSQMPKRHSHFRRQFHLRRQWLIMNPVANYEPKFLVKYGIWCRGKLKGVISHNVGRHLFVFSCLQFLSSSHLLLTF